MKKLAILAVVALVFACASCNKTKNCKCTSTGGWTNMEPVSQEVTTTIDKGECTDYNAHQHMEAGGEIYDVTTTCVEI